jgi:hypothetical protein
MKGIHTPASDDANNNLILQEFSLIFLLFLMPLFAGNYKTKEFRVHSARTLSKRENFFLIRPLRAERAREQHSTCKYISLFLILKSHCVANKIWCVRLNVLFVCYAKRSTRAHRHGRCDERGAATKLYWIIFLDVFFTLK